MCTIVEKPSALHLNFITVQLENQSMKRCFLKMQVFAHAFDFGAQTCPFLLLNFF